MTKVLIFIILFPRSCAYVLSFAAHHTQGMHSLSRKDSTVVEAASSPLSKAELPNQVRPN